jgi:hypothetical protein
VKIVYWTRDSCPELEIDDDGNYVFEDSPIEFNLELGDQIQYLSFTGHGTKCYFVIEVSPYNDFDGIYSSQKLVTIE